MYCKHCGTELLDGQNFCANCGAQVECPKPENKKPANAGLNVGMLVWSILGIALCNSPFSIPALVMTILASVSTPEEASKKISIARTFNIVSIIYGIVNILAAMFVWFIYYVIFMTMLFGY